MRGRGREVNLRFVHIAHLDQKVSRLVFEQQNVQTRGSSLVPTGGLALSKIFQAGLQLNMPLRNRIAQADAERDTLQLRQAQGRTAKLENDIRQQIENAAVAIENAHQAYAGGGREPELSATASKSENRQVRRGGQYKFSDRARPSLLGPSAFHRSRRAV